MCFGSLSPRRPRALALRCSHAAESARPAKARSVARFPKLLTCRSKRPRLLCVRPNRATTARHLPPQMAVEQGQGRRWLMWRAQQQQHLRPALARLVQLSLRRKPRKLSYSRIKRLNMVNIHSLFIIILMELHEPVSGAQMRAACFRPGGA